MAAEYSANASQTIPAGGSVVFTESPVPCRCGYIYHRDESGLFRLVNRFFRQNLNGGWRRNSNYQVSFHANVEIPAGGTVEPISLAISIDGEVDPSSTMVFVPAAVETPGNVGAEVIVTVPYVCGCSTVSVRNTSAQDITVSNANIVFTA